MPKRVNDPTTTHKQLIEGQKDRVTSDFRGYTVKEQEAIKHFRVRSAIRRAKLLKEWQHDPLHNTWMDR